jgi:hypothetical protein
MRFVRPDRIWLKEHPELNERWVQDRITEDPAIIGLGDLVLKDKERRQPHAGRLDLLLQDPDNDRRYELELQLGRTDESHIIRTIEYWDIERRRYPQYDHCAVIVAEDIASRFLNVIGLFNSSIPIIAIQMAALAIGDQVALVFNTILNELSRGLEEEEDDSHQDPVDRGYWEGRVGRDIIGMADQLFNILRQRDPSLEMKYNKYSIVLAKSGVVDKFVSFRPKRQFLRVEARLPQSEETDSRLEEAGLDLLPYKWGKYRVRVTKADLNKQEAVIADLLKLAYENREAA